MYYENSFSNIPLLVLFTFKQIDVFSYGLLVCETSIRELPDSEEIRRKGQIKRIQNSGVRKLVEQCTKIDPRKRPTMRDVIGRWLEIK